MRVRPLGFPQKSSVYSCQFYLDLGISNTLAVVMFFLVAVSGIFSCDWIVQQICEKEKAQTKPRWLLSNFESNWKCNWIIEISDRENSYSATLFSFLREVDLAHSMGISRFWDPYRRRIKSQIEFSKSVTQKCLFSIYFRLKFWS